MRTVILAGGLGTRLAEETEARPRPMVEIGGRPILWHIFKHYTAYGLRDFVIALGYKSEVVKRFLVDYVGLSGNPAVEAAGGRVVQQDRACEDWTVHRVETGQLTNTGGRLKRVADWVRGETFMLTYGDGLSDVDVAALVAFHRRMGKLATVTAVRPPARFGGRTFDGELIREFTEKPQIGEGWVNGGFLVLEPGVLDPIEGDQTSLKIEALSKLPAIGQLAAYRHPNFWRCMDTLRDKRLLETLWQEGRASWKVGA